MKMVELEKLISDHIQHLDEAVICDCDEVFFFPLLRDYHAKLEAN